MNATDKIEKRAKDGAGSMVAGSATKGQKCDRCLALPSKRGQGGLSYFLIAWSSLKIYLPSRGCSPVLFIYYLLFSIL